MAEVKLIKMVREDGFEADVHPDEVENYRAGGFSVLYSEAEAEQQADAKPKKAKK